MTRPVAYVASVGVRSSIGLTSLQTAMLFRSGAAGMREAPLLDVEGERVTMCFVPTVDPLVTGWEREVALATPAIEEALAPWAGQLNGDRVQLSLCLDERYGRAPRGSAEAAAGAALGRAIHEKAHALFPGMGIEVAARGQASAALCLPGALTALTSRRLDAVVLGAVHSDYEPSWIERLSADRRIFKPDNLDSFIPGELAVFLVLVAADTARRAGRPTMAGVVASAAAVEAATLDNNRSSYEALGLTGSVRGVTGEMVEAGQTAGWAITDLTFEHHRVHEWQAMLIRTREAWSEPYVVDSPAQRLGHTGAAAIPLGMALAAVGWHHGSAPAPRAVVHGSSDGGDRGAVLLTEP